MISRQHQCPACYHDEFSWWCWQCDTWPCVCAPGQEGGDGAQEETPVHEEAVSISEGGQSGSASDASTPAGVHAVPLREAPETDLAPEQEAARVRAGHCGYCGKPGIQGQPFSGGREYYCPSCEEVYSYPDAAPSESPFDNPLSLLMAQVKDRNAVIAEKEAEITRLRSQARTARNKMYNAWGAMRIPGGTPYADGVAAARAILLEAMNSLGWQVFDPDQPSVTKSQPGSWCPQCYTHFPGENHYHCSLCGKRTSMMGHSDGCPST